jgi:Na+-driven multidrug efflux pump
VIVSASTSSAIGIVFWVLIVVFRHDLAQVFTSSTIIMDAVSKLSILLAFTILLNSVQPVLSGKCLFSFIFFGSVITVIIYYLILRKVSIWSVTTAVIYYLIVVGFGSDYCYYLLFNFEKSQYLQCDYCCYLLFNCGWFWQ